MRTYKHLITYQQNEDKSTLIGDKSYNYQSTITGMQSVNGLHKILTLSDLEIIVKNIKEYNNNSSSVIILNDILLGDDDID